MTIMVGANSVTSAVPIGSTPRMPIAGGSTNDPKPGKNGNSGRPLFPKSHLPVFSLLLLFGEII
jgi:hypothetical protein